MAAIKAEPRAAQEQKHVCPACGGASLESFYVVKNVPVNSCILMASREEALGYPKGEINLVYCHDCGFIYNAKFDEKLIEHSGRYEETQGYSRTFNAFHERLAENLIERHDLHGKEILEIGCGKGEFLTLLCDLGENRGTGFDSLVSSPLVDRHGRRQLIRPGLQVRLVRPGPDHLGLALGQGGGIHGRTGARGAEECEKQGCQDGQAGGHENASRSRGE